MGSIERSKKKVQLWKKAVVHFSLCFVMGFFTGFAPSAKSSIFSTHISSLNKSQFSPQPIEMLHAEITPQSSATNFNKTIDQTPSKSIEYEHAKFMENENQELSQEEEEKEPQMPPRKLVTIITPTSTKEAYQEVFLRRLANTIKLVPPPLLWIVVEGQTDSNVVSELLRKTGIMYRHLVSKENFTDSQAELDHQRNLALRHLEQHRLGGIVHFAGLSNVYDLAFFDELREIEGFGTWPIALLSANKNKVIIEGPICDSSQVIGWHLKKMNNNNETDSSNKPPIHISSFAFNSSILWDPERWGRPSSTPHTAQNSIKFVEQAALEDETKIKGIPPEECSKIMLWQLKFSKEKESSNEVFLNNSIDRKNGDDQGDKMNQKDLI